MSSVTPDTIENGPRLPPPHLPDPTHHRHLRPAHQPADEKEVTMIHLYLVFLLPVVLMDVPAAARPRPEKDTPEAKKLIEWGWDEPDTKFMRENIEKMERFPFDGLVFHATSGKGDNLAWEVWGGKKFSPDDFKQAVDDLKATRFTRFTDRLLRVNVTPAKVDWFDDDTLASVVNNFGVAGQVDDEG